jgi:hypothetical protein
MTQNVADIGYILPGNLRMLRLHVRREVAGRLRDDLDAALDREPEHSVVLIIVDGLSGDEILNFLDRVQDVLEP